MTTVRVRLEHSPAVHYPALFWIDRTAIGDTNTAWSKAAAMPPVFSDSEVCDCLRSQSNWTDKNGMKQVIGSNAEINEVKLRVFLDRQLRSFESKKPGFRA